ncbi:winged helix-turn-helix transcriptional regulator [Rhodococcus pyridinivorans]|uniref:winged helix-turn-helix transcriptional regulator n=1 Tax=Rhodococcus pyridinivorans TaxID=103816 RepID=UPI002283DA6A|nr:helix-turn-helix domain-containing protein [Rhodococcus pyridinivorans]WAL46595.1 helix-turn-helix domain-containing protein [Rhodococcus pyridinivorans]
MAGRIRLEDRECPLSTTLGLVGEWWTVLILHDCFDGYSRFDEFQDNTGISSSMLTSRLKALVEAGILERKPYQERPVRYEYVLTALGRSLRPVLIALAAWRNAQLAAQERSMILVDSHTGREVEPVVVDAATGERVDDPRYIYTAGPAAGPEMRERYARRTGAASGRADADADADADDGHEPTVS